MKSRLKKVQHKIKQKKLDALLISTVANIIYLTGYRGFSKEEREAYLLITEKNAYLFTDARYTDAVITHIPHVNVIEVSQSNPITKALARIAKEEKIIKAGFEPHNMTVSEYVRLKKAIKLVATNSVVETVREIKEPSEIAAIEASCKLGDKTFDYILPFLKEGITEQEVAQEMKMYMRKTGAKPSFPTIVAFGKNAAIPHHHTGTTKLKSRDLVLLDFGVQQNGYCSDMTRTVFVGKPTDEEKKMYNTVLTAQSLAIEQLNNVTMANKTVSASDIDKVAREYIITQGFPTIPHSLGHGIGLEVHELPRLSPKSKSKLMEGMVFSVEPGIYFKDKGGVRIEDLIVIEKGGPRLLTNSPKHIVELL